MRFKYVYEAAIINSPVGYNVQNNSRGQGQRTLNNYKHDDELQKKIRIRSFPSIISDVVTLY